MAVFRRDPCGIMCLIVTYAAVFYADYCLVQHVVVPTLSDRYFCSFLYNMRLFLRRLVIPVSAFIRLQ